jgi:uncharacterized membrane protein YdjX (TVP38/TMEM64 family)
MHARSPYISIAGLVMVLVAALVAALLVRPDPDDIEGAFTGLGLFGPILFAAAYAALTVLLVPGAPLTIAAGALFGVAGGGIVVMIGATCGAAASFAISRRSTRGAVERARGARLEALERRFGGQGFPAMLLLRLVPLVPFNALNYAAGATAITTRDYLLATVIGIAPGVFVFTALGAGLKDPLSPLFIGAVVLLVAMSLVTWRISRRVPVDLDPPGPTEVGDEAP